MLTALLEPENSSGPTVSELRSTRLGLHTGFGNHGLWLLPEWHVGQQRPACGPTVGACFSYEASSISRSYLSHRILRTPII